MVGGNGKERGSDDVVTKACGQRGRDYRVMPAQHSSIFNLTSLITGSSEAPTASAMRRVPYYGALGR